MIVTERFPQIEAPVRPTIWEKLTAPLPDRMLSVQRPADETHEMVAVDTVSQRTFPPAQQRKRRC
jgi:hypothetical protein